jgi:hypothetical protein
MIFGGWSIFFMAEKIEIFTKELKKKRKIFVASMLAGLFVALSMMVYFIKNSLTVFIPIRDFSGHIISQASAHNVDIDARISTYYNYIALFFLAFFVLGLLFYSLLKNRADTSQKQVSFLSNIALLATVSVACSLLLNYEFSQILFVIFAFALPIVLTIEYIYIAKNNNRDFDMMFYSISIALVLSVFLKVALDKMGFSGIIGVFAYITITSLFAIIIFFITQTKLIRYKDKIIIASIPILFSGIVQCIALEVINIINVRANIVINRSFEIYAGIIAISIILFVVLFVFSKKTGNTKLIYKLFLPMTILLFALVIAQPLRTVGAGKEFFESANHELSLHQFFTFGSIPIIESFDAHMLSNQLFGYLYSLINGYEPWAIVLYNSLYIPIQFLIIYYLLKRIIGKKLAFFFVLGFPILGMVFYHMFIYCALMFFALQKLLKQNSLKNRIILVSLCFVLCIFRLDIGFAATVAAIFTYAAFNLSKEKIKNLLDLIITGLVVIGIIGIFYLIICLFKDIAPITRLKEILAAAGSSQNWGYAGVGDKAMVKFNLLLYILPLVVISMIIWVFSKVLIFEKENKYNFVGLAMLLFFSAFYLLNISRGVVRHSFIESDNAWYILSTVFIALLSLSILRKKKNVKQFTVILCVCILILGIAYPSFNSKESPMPNARLANKNLITSAYSAKNYGQQYEKSQPMNGSRVTGENNIEALRFKAVLETLLLEKQSYIDLASLNTFYALTDRKNPSFINQLPMMLSGDYMQETAIGSFEKQDLPIAILPISMDQDIGFGSAIDDLYVDYKYYLLFEYVYSKYVPLIRMNGFDIYCEKEKKDDYIEKLGYDYNIIDSQTQVETRRLGEVPMLWGEKDGNDAIANTPLLSEKLTDITSVMSTKPLKNSQPMNLAIEITSAQRAMGTVRLIACNQTVADFSFFINAGTHTYVVRLSSDYNYWETRTDAVVLESGAPVDISKLSLLSEDGSYYALID